MGVAATLPEFSEWTLVRMMFLDIWLSYKNFFMGGGGGGGGQNLQLCNFYCYSNFCIVLGPNFRRENFSEGRGASHRKPAA